MSKIKVEDMACFKQVAKVIGVENAKRELFVALRDYKCERFKVNPNARLIDAFDWVETPQGDEFWDAIDDGILPIMGDISNE